jgi:DNA-binding transcriptional LysR family regulator
MLDLASLSIFVHSAESASFSQAARELHLTQPTVSYHIKILEQELGVELFDRNGTSLLLTDAGKTLLPRARKLLHDATELQQIMESIQEKVSGDLRIACSTTTGKYVLSQFAARFRVRHPEVKVSILRCTSADIVPILLEESADLGVVSYDLCGGKLECQEFFEDHIILIAPIGHIWNNGNPIEPWAITEQPFILREPSSGTRKVMLAELGGHDITLDDMNIFLEVGNAEAIVKTVEGGFGVSFISRCAADWALQLGSVAEIPLSGLDLRRKVYMVRKGLTVVNRAAEAFWGFVHDPMNIDLLQMAAR